MCRLSYDLTRIHPEMYSIQVEDTTQKTQNICMTFVQCWYNVEDVGPTLYTCYTNVFVFAGQMQCLRCRVSSSMSFFIDELTFSVGHYVIQGISMRISMSVCIRLIG